MAPDKIYLQITEGQEIPEEGWSGLPLAQYNWKKVVANVEYVRKDTIISLLNRI